jgi:hypothetical protein
MRYKHATVEQKAHGIAWRKMGTQAWYLGVVGGCRKAK